MSGIREDIEIKLDEWRTAVRQYLNNPTFDEEPEYLSKPMHYALKAEGKMLRPALCLAATEAVGGDWRDAVIVAAALEIFHTFSLVHDDIMDGDELRRGIPTLHQAFDANQALLSGDTLLIYVYQLLSKIEDSKFPQIFKSFNDGAMDVCKGQGWDMEFEKRNDIKPHEYEMMIDLKTGALIRLACQLGGIVGGGNESVIQNLSRFGVLLGRAFQMQDDLLEVTSSAEAMGKSLGSDVLNEKKTWIWLDLKKRLLPHELEKWQDLQQKSTLPHVQLELIRDLMQKHGTLERAQNLVQSWIDEADTILADSAFQNAQMLKALSNIILKRKS